MFGRELQKKKKNIFLTNLTLFEVSYFYVDIEREREREKKKKEKKRVRRPTCSIFTSKIE